jgi:hypothetical protein
MYLISPETKFQIFAVLLKFQYAPPLADLLLGVLISVIGLRKLCSAASVRITNSYTTAAREDVHLRKHTIHHSEYLCSTGNSGLSSN